MQCRPGFNSAALVLLGLVIFGCVSVSRDALAEGPAGTKYQRADENGVLDALQFVQETGLNRNFGEMIMSFSMKTQTVQGLILRHGSAAVTTSLLNNTNQVIQIRGPEWDEKLASLYADYFTEAEMYSLLHDRNDSPYLEKLKLKHSEIGTKMQSASWDLMQQAVVETIAAVIEDLSDTTAQ